MVEEEQVNWGKQWIMIATWLTWAVGAFCDHEVVSLAFVNLFHGLPSFVLVYMVTQRIYADKEQSNPLCSDRFVIFMTKRWHLFLPFLSQGKFCKKTGFWFWNAAASASFRAAA